jgi:hypothetical protein
MIKIAINNKWKNFLLLEDDAIVLNRYEKVMQQIEQQLQKSRQRWDIIYLGWHAFQYENHKFAGLNLKIETDYKRNGLAVLTAISQCGGLFAALINESLYETILKMPPIGPIDSQLNNLKINGMIRAYNVVPMAIYTKSVFSNCEQQYIERDVL